MKRLFYDQKKLLLQVIKESKKNQHNEKDKPYSFNSSHDDST